jgi:hypothetical protein
MSAIQAERVRTTASDVAVPRRISKSTTRFLALVFVASRLLNVAFVLLGRSKIIPFALNDAGPGTGGSWLSPWTFFDGRWYLSISGKGYEGFTSVFYPLFPNILKLAGSDPDHRAMFGVVFSTICFALALPALFRLVASSHGERAARIACFIIAFMPFSAVWGAVYTESLALLLLVTTWAYVRKGRWARAALPALLVGLTRNVGFVLAFAMGLEYLQQRRYFAVVLGRRGDDETRETRETRERFDDPATIPVPTQRATVVLAVCALPAIASASFMFWASRRFGAAGGLAAQEAYARGLAWPWWAVWKDATSVLSYLTIGKMLSLFGIGLAAVVSYQQRRRLRLGEHAIVWGVLAMHLLLARQNPPHTIGAARYLMTGFPFAIGLGVGIDRLPKRWAAPLALLVIAVCALGAYTFGSGQFEIG